MNKTKLLLQALLLIALFTQCESDPGDERLATESKFIYKGKEYALTNGYMGLSCSTPTEDGSLHAIEVYLFSSDTEFTGLCPGFNAAGTGNGIALSLVSESASELTTGIYAEPNQFNLNDQKLNSAKLYQYVNYSGAGQGTFLDSGMNGSVTVSITEKVYTITFTLEVAPAKGGGTVTGKFIGEIEEY